MAFCENNNDLYRCDHCGQTNQLSSMFSYNSSDETSDETNDLLACSVSCYMAMTTVSVQAACLHEHGGIHPATEREFWFKDMDGVDHYKMKCTECFTDISDSVCPSNHEPAKQKAKQKWGEKGSKGCHLQAVDPQESWLCDDCGSRLSRGELASLLSTTLSS